LKGYIRCDAEVEGLEVLRCYVLRFPDGAEETEEVLRGSGGEWIAWIVGNIARKVKLSCCCRWSPFFFGQVFWWAS
jgi:hypothetical protein